MSVKPTVNLEIIDSSLTGDVRDKLARLLVPIFEVKKGISEEYYLQLITDYRHMLKQPEHNILDFSVREFGWKDIFDVDLLGISIKKKYDNNVKTSLLKDIINVDKNNFYHHSIVVKLSPESFCFFAIIGKKLNDVFEVEKMIANKTEELSKALEEKDRNNTEANNQRYTKLKFDLDNLGSVHSSKIDKVTKDLEGLYAQITEIKSNHLEDTNKLASQLVELNTTLTNSLNNSATELKSHYEEKLMCCMIN